MQAIITPSWFETALDCKPQILGSYLVHKLSVISTALDYKLRWKRGFKLYKSQLVLARVRYLVTLEDLNLFGLKHGLFFYLTYLVFGLYQFYVIS